MTPDRYQQIKRTLAGALDQDDTQRRVSFLEESCESDPDLRAEVESLLEQPADEFDLVAETIGLANPEPPVPNEAGRRVGAYELVRELGRGGMGAVWLARRADEHFEKLVAIKLLKRGTDTDEVLRRFLVERRILARLDHPNIARLVDAGMTDDHLPYFVMEYIEGARVTDYAFAQNLSLAARLRLFTKVCQAVQFAHQNLVIHRDLKPANILVAADGEPKLLDFGVAKLLDPLDDAWQITKAGQERFTPGYASPEQVRNDPITTVSDVYSLGAVLYELLTGAMPHQFATSKPTQTQIAQVICEVEPSRPSAAAKTAELQRQLRGDLDTILLRALAKDPARRYRGAGQLGDDLLRYLENRPVRARPDTFRYRAGKFLRRNRKAAIAAGLLVISLLGGAVATLREAQIAKHERARAVQRATQVRKIANSFMIDFYNMIAELPGSLAARQLVTAKAVDYLDSLAREESDDLSLESELAQAYSKIGSVTFDVAKAIETHQKAATLNERLVRAKPRNVSYVQQLADSYDQLSDLMKIAGRSAASIDYARRSFELTRSVTPNDQAELAGAEMGLAIALSDAGNFKNALEQDRSAVERYRAIAAKAPADKEAQRRLESALLRTSSDERELGQIEQATRDAQAAFEIATAMFASEATSSRTQRDMWSAHFHLAQCLAAKGEADAAREHYRQAVELMEGLAAADPTDIGHQRWLAVTYSAMGDALAASGQAEEAQALQQRALALSDKLAAEDPNRAEVKRDLIHTNQSLGALYQGAGDTPRARSCYDKARELAESLLAIDPQNAAVAEALRRARHSLDGVR